MAKPLRLALLLPVVLAASAAAQTATTSRGVTGTSLASPYGAVSLPANTITATSAATATPSSSAAGTGTGASSGGAASGASSATGSSGTRSSTLGSVGAASSGRTASSGSSGGGAAGPSINVPAWLLCPPAGAGGLAPFVAGTDLSCAP